MTGTILANLILCLSVTVPARPQADTVIVSDSSKYIGQYPAGQGVLYTDMDGLFIGHFVDGIPEGLVTHYLPDGSIYHGSMSGGRHCGYGHFFSESGKIHAGEFKDGYANGQDTLYYPDGSVYIGQCRWGRPVPKKSEDYGRLFSRMHVRQDILDAKPVFDGPELTPEQEKFMKDARKRYAAYIRKHPTREPQFKGQSTGAFSRWVSGRLKYPDAARRDNVYGTVMIRFTVDRDGSVTDVQAVSSPHPALAEEAVRTVSSSPAWSPGVRKGEKMRVTYTIPVIFAPRRN